MLRDYQMKAACDIYAAFQDVGRVLFYLPTGGGKTFTFCHIAKDFAENEKRVLILAHRRELLAQIERTIDALGIHPRPQIASVQGLARKLDGMEKPDLIIMDEAHHAIAGQWAKICAAFKCAKILGVSATPCRADGKGLSAAFDKIVFGPSPRQLMESGSLCYPKIYTLPMCIDRDGMGKRGGDFKAENVAERFAANEIRIYGDVLAAYRKYHEGQTVVFAPNVATARSIAQMFCDNGHRFACIDGQMSIDDRERAVRELTEGKLDGLTSCEIISEGFDCPAIGTAMLLRPTASTSLYLQQAGRALRTLPGKTHGVLIDLVGNAMEHGSPEDDRPWSLDGKANGKTESRTGIRVCGSCFGNYKPGPTCCPYCGSSTCASPAQIVSMGGELEEYTGKKDTRSKHCENMRLAMEVIGRMPTKFADFIPVVRALGVQMGWAYGAHKLLEKHGPITKEEYMDKRGYIVQTGEKIKGKVTIEGKSYWINGFVKKGEELTNIVLSEAK